MSRLVLRFANVSFLALLAIAGGALSAPYLPGAVSPSVSTQAQNQDESTNIRVYQQASPAVVAISAGESSGSGSIITRDGLILTNAHVVGSARTVTVQLSDGQQFEADVVGYAEDGLDLAAVKIRGGGNFPMISLASDRAQVGQQAFAIGNPFGLQGTFTVGIVSRLDQTRGLIQTDAAINPGNSGGPLLNSQGELIGVNTSIFTTEASQGNIGIGFAIATDQVRPFIAAVQNGSASTTASSRPRQGGRPPETISLNGQSSGRLDSSSNLFADNSYFNVYRFEGQAGQRVAIEMSSQQIDPYLILVGPNQEDLGQDDDSAGGVNARLETTLPANGTYLILANSYAANEEGNYEIQLSSLGGAGQPSQANRYLLEETGRLEPGDPQLRDGSFYDEFAFEGQAGQQVIISLTSSDFDTYLFLADEAGNQIAENDDLSGSSTNSEIVVTLPRQGLYRVVANAYDAQGQGSYRLSIR
ncbi:MAG: trypsin-like peptidase domain-containing protein [Cyanobacteria bacterium P01_G01_bin.38]